jgi:hypothetical protein
VNDPSHLISIACHVYTSWGHAPRTCHECMPRGRDV